MGMEEFSIELAALLEIDRSELIEDYQLEENENWDSLALISVIVMVDEHYHFTISNEAIRKCIVFGDLIKLINEKRKLFEK